MQAIPKEILKYTEISTEKMGRVMKKDAPKDIIQKAVEWERDFYSKTSRRAIVDLDIDDSGNFVGDLNNEEIQILATFMKCEWLNREILTWENIKPLYVERDFSQANLIDKLQKLLDREESKARKLERIYYRSIHYKPFDYTKLAGE